jgi:hypothetical protein
MIHRPLRTQIENRTVRLDDKTYQLNDRLIEPDVKAKTQGSKPPIDGPYVAKR